MTYNDKYYNLLEEANRLGITQFIFEFDKKYYISNWTKGLYWSEPRLIIKLPEELE